mmetsp:Transcript_1725/g.4009  ORF Transcript_1725/g.4009 Transcript_1725/m.4009 type:complete len:403 (+) Transcript_1725:61-1269(+)|eukprot:CAMPEP_0114499830 /NCGR_PEP_ID=MMETSP0109-20121206/7631_1 /TAXON_ID=29199 /ORGANISM="Chlorarachnion reptans, Strain CCCM449" /LENGTH=402 /DNA_ID=CAMNT_0001677433 /DNA_START=29 /DNA_END=1237 /DNA_ORIENTATION=+
MASRQARPSQPQAVASHVIPVHVGHQRSRFVHVDQTTFFEFCNELAISPSASIFIVDFLFHGKCRGVRGDWRTPFSNASAADPLVDLRGAGVLRHCAVHGGVAAFLGLIEEFLYEVLPKHRRTVKIILNTVKCAFMALEIASFLSSIPTGGSIFVLHKLLEYSICTACYGFGRVEGKRIAGLLRSKFSKQDGPDIPPEEERRLEAGFREAENTYVRNIERARAEDKKKRASLKQPQKQPESGYINIGMCTLCGGERPNCVGNFHKSNGDGKFGHIHLACARCSSRWTMKCQLEPEKHDLKDTHSHSCAYCRKIVGKDETYVLFEAKSGKTVMCEFDSSTERSLDTKMSAKVFVGFCRYDGCTKTASVLTKSNDGSNAFEFEFCEAHGKKFIRENGYIIVPTE